LARLGACLELARLHYGEGSQQAGRWVHQIAADLRVGKVQEVIARLKCMRPRTPKLREKLQGLIAYYSEHAAACGKTSTSVWATGLKWRRGERAQAGGACSLSVKSGHALERSRGAAVVGAPTAVVERQLGFIGSPADGVGGLISIGLAAEKNLVLRRGDARCSGHCPRLETPGDLRARLEVARLDLLAMFRALDRMDLSPVEIPQDLLSYGNSWKRMPIMQKSFGRSTSLREVWIAALCSAMPTRCGWIAISLRPV
jgi:hypothetical protein